MPVHKTKGGWKWGNSGHVYKTKASATAQARAIYAAGYKGKDEELPEPLNKL